MNTTAKPSVLIVPVLTNDMEEIAKHYGIDDIDASKKARCEALATFFTERRHTMTFELFTFSVMYYRLVWKDGKKLDTMMDKCCELMVSNNKNITKKLYKIISNTTYAIK